MIKIATDSTCDLPEEAYRDHDITVVPINIQFGTETYQDRIDIDRPTFYAKIEETGKLPTTSQPSAGQFEAHYRRMMAAGAQDILSLHVTARLSGTLQSAELARALLAGEVRVHPFDSACGSAGLGFMAVEAAQMASAGRSVADILARLEVMRERMNIVLTLRDLRFAQMSGRVGRLQSSLASLLNVKPIVVLQAGIIDVQEKVRSQRRAVERMFKIATERVDPGKIVNLAVIHADTPDEGQELLDQARSIWNCRQSFLANLTTSLVVHFGPGTLGIVAYEI